MDYRFNKKPSPAGVAVSACQPDRHSNSKNMECQCDRHNKHPLSGGVAKTACAVPEQRPDHILPNPAGCVKARLSNDFANLRKTLQNPSGCIILTAAKANVRMCSLSHRKKRPPGRDGSSPGGRFLRCQALLSLAYLSSHLLTQWETTFAATDTINVKMCSNIPTSSRCRCRWGTAQPLYQNPTGETSQPAIG